MRHARTDPRAALVLAMLAFGVIARAEPVLAQVPPATVTAPQEGAPTSTPAATTTPAASGDLVILALRVNQVAKGEIMILLDPDLDPAETDSVWLEAAAFEALAVGLAPLPRSSLDGQEYVLLESSAQIDIELDLDALRLSLSFAPELLASQVISLSTGSDAPPSATLPTHAWVDYDVAARSDGARWDASAAMAGNLAVGGWSIRTEHVASTGDSGSSSERLRTFAERDWPQQMVRASVGDLSPARLPFGRLGALTGFRVARLFELRPGFASPPPFSFTGSADTPSTAEIYLDGSLLRTVPIEPGRFEMRDLSYYSGLRDVRIVIADAFGGRQEILVPHYFSEAPLRAGLHEFEYSIGTPRRYGEEDGSDSGEAFTGWHRYGFLDNLTVGAGLEATRDYHAASVDTSWVPGRVGTFRGHYSRSSSSIEGEDREGSARMLGYGYSSGGFSFSITDWRQDPGFGRQDDFPLVPVSGLAPKRRTSLDLSVALPAQQSVGLSLGRDKDQGGSQSDRLGIRYSTRLAGAISVFARVARSREDGRYANEAAVGVQFDLGRGWSGGVGLEQGPSGARQSLSVDRGRPDEGGWGGRALLENDSDWSRLEAVASRDFEAGAFTGLMSHRQGSGTSSGTALAAQFGGSLVYAGGDLRAARPVRDAFALVDTNGLAGVRVYRNNTLAGVTDSQGRLLLPGLGSYTRNQIRLDDRDIPIEVQLDAMTVDAVPRSRIGADVRFDTRRIISAGGRLRSRGPAGEASVAAAQILVTVDGTEVETSTGPDGDFYLDSLVPGEFVLQVRNASVACRAVMRVAKDAPAFTDLGELDCVSAP